MLIPIALLVLGQTVSATTSPTAVNVRVTTRIVTLEQSAVTRAGLSYVVLGHDRVRIAGRPRGVQVQIGTQGVSAFLEAAHNNQWIRSESTQSVLTLSGSEAMISSQTLRMTSRTARTQGPAMHVIPTVLEDGRVRLYLSAAKVDQADYWWGTVDGSPVATETELIVRPGEEVIVASSSAVNTSREAGILRWTSREEQVEAMVVLSVTLD